MMGALRQPSSDLQLSFMLLRFWGVRGSTPTPARENLRYGGNTPCLEVRTPAGHLFLFDCGTGLRKLGRSLVAEFGRRPIRARVFLTHYHWDHIQGIPFFAPLYNPRNEFRFHCFRLPAASMREALEGQMAHPYFPVDMGVMRANRQFTDIAEDAIACEDLRLRTRWLNHPQGCLGYRLECRGKVIVYATDNEPGDAKGDANVRMLAQGADALVYDAQYTPEEYRKAHRGWGHSTWEEGVKIAQQMGVKRLILFHHDPEHNDEFVDDIVRTARRRFKNVDAAREGMVIQL